jgi:hypothetical protein
MPEARAGADRGPVQDVQTAPSDTLNNSPREALMKTKNHTLSIALALVALAVAPLAAFAGERPVASEAAAVAVQGTPDEARASSDDDGGPDDAINSFCFWSTTYCSDTACANGGARGTHFYDCYDANGNFTGTKPVSTCCGG